MFPTGKTKDDYFISGCLYPSFSIYFKAGANNCKMTMLTVKILTGSFNISCKMVFNNGNNNWCIIYEFVQKRVNVEECSDPFHTNHFAVFYDVIGFPMQYENQVQKNLIKRMNKAEEAFLYIVKYAYSKFRIDCNPANLSIY